MEITGLGKIFDKTVKKFYTPVVKKVVYKSLPERAIRSSLKQLKV